MSSFRMIDVPQFATPWTVSAARSSIIDFWHDQEGGQIDVSLATGDR
jgi:hypothetical protein